jgi:uncharacterized membrane protein YhhN
MMARERRFHHDATTASSEGGSLFLGGDPLLFHKRKLISDEQMEVRIALGALIALLVISAIVVWIYASRT